MRGRRAFKIAKLWIIKKILNMNARRSAVRTKIYTWTTESLINTQHFDHERTKLFRAINSAFELLSILLSKMKKPECSMGPKIHILIVFFSNVNYMNTSIPIVKLCWAHGSVDKKTPQSGDHSKVWCTQKSLDMISQKSAAYFNLLLYRHLCQGVVPQQSFHCGAFEPALTFQFWPWGNSLKILQMQPISAHI